MMSSVVSGGLTGPSSFAWLPRALGRPRGLLRTLRALRAEGAFVSLAPTADGSAPYARRVLHQDEVGEVMLAAWTGREACAPHDHGHSRGAVFVLSGAFCETAYTLAAGALQAVTVRERRAGELAHVPRGVIHGLSPRCPGLTLHVYAPKVEHMRVFDLERREVLTVADECGAWIPKDERLVRARAAIPAAAY